MRRKGLATKRLTGGTRRRRERSPRGRQRSEAVSEKEVTALGLAAFKGHLDAVKVLVGAGADVNRRMEVSKTAPITLAVRAGHVDIVRALLDAGGKLDGPVATASLIVAVWLGNEEMTRVLLQAGAPVGGTDRWGLRRLGKRVG